MSDLEDSTSDTGLTDAMSSPPGGDDFLVDSPGEGKAKPDPKLISALVLAVLCGGGWLAYQHLGGPKPATASAIAAVSVNDGAKKTIAEFLSAGGKDLAAMEKMLRDTEMVVRQFTEYPSMTQVPLSELRTNPFRSAPAPEEQTPAVEVKRQRDDQRQRALKAVGELEIESIMIGRNGRSGTAIINGKFVRPGDTVDGFTVEDIRPGSVIVKDDTFRFELRLSK